MFLMAIQPQFLSKATSVRPTKTQLSAKRTEGTHLLIVYMHATGVYRSFRDFFAQTQIDDPNGIVIVFDFDPAVTPSPLSRYPPKPEPIDLLFPISVMLASVIVSFMLWRRHRKISPIPFP